MAGGRLTREALLKIEGDITDLEEKLRKATEEADKLRAKHPTMKISVDDAEAKAKLDLLRAKLDAATRDKTIHIEVKTGKLGLLERLLGGLSGVGGGGGNGLASGGLTSPAAIAGIGAAILALLPLLAGIVAGLVAATAGVGAFAAVALPTFIKLKTDIAAVYNANQAFQESAKNVSTAIKSSALNAAAYNQALAAMPANLASATRLLGNQAVRWQDLTRAQQNNVVALANNKKALSSLLPSQRTALTQLLAAKAAWDDMSPAQQAAARSLNNLANSYQKIVAALQPTVFKVLNAGLKVTNDLLPALGPLAKAGGDAIGGLLQKVDTFVKSKGFQNWLKQFTSLVGPSLTAIGTGVGKVIIQFGKLLTIMSRKDVVHALNIAFDVLAGSLRVVAFLVARLMLRWDQYSAMFEQWARNSVRWTKAAQAGVNHALLAIGQGANRLVAVLRGAWIRSALDVGQWVNAVRGWIGRVVNAFWRVPGQVASGLRSLPGMLFRIGVNALMGLLHGIQSMVGSILGTIGHLASSIGGAFASILGLHSPSRVFRDHGRNIVRGLILGINDQGPAAVATIRRLSAQVGAGGAAAAGAARVGRSGPLIQLALAPGGTALDQLLWTYLKKQIRVHGGDPTVLGR